MELVKTLKESLANLPPPTEIKNIQAFDEKLKTLNNVIQDTINKHVEKAKPSPYSKRWWSTELSEEKKQMQQLAGRAKYQCTNLSMMNITNNATNIQKRYNKQKPNTG
jgi:predicted transcriptional regulator